MLLLQVSFFVIIVIIVSLLMGGYQCSSLQSIVFFFSFCSLFNLINHMMIITTTITIVFITILTSLPTIQNKLDISVSCCLLQTWEENMTEHESNPIKEKVQHRRFQGLKVKGLLNCMEKLPDRKIKIYIYIYIYSMKML